MMKNNNRLRLIARDIRLEYLKALGGTTGIIPNSKEFKDQLNLITALSKDGELITADGKRLTTVEQIRAYFGLCQLGRGHWSAQCEQHNCMADLGQHDRQIIAAAQQYVFGSAPSSETTQK